MSVPTDGEDTGQKGPRRVSYKEGVEEGRLTKSCIVAKRGKNIEDLV